jgi:hypothetical protein
VLRRAHDPATGTDNSPMTLSQAQYDLAGRVTRETNALLGVTKRIIMIPSGNAVNLQTFDLNKALETFMKK